MSGLINPEWSFVYHKAINDDGSLFFPQRLTQAFLDGAKRSMGSYLFANQYLNEIIPDGQQTFKKAWIRYYAELPARVHTFGFVDPAISEADTADNTGISIVSVDADQNWYVRYARRHRLNPSELIELCFRLCEQFGLLSLGIEDVAFQRAIIHFAHEEMKRRGKRIPITGVKRGTDKTKEMRILGLVPRFEWGTLLLAQGLHDLELELSQFPRGSHDDVLDSLSSMDAIIHYPTKEKTSNAAPSPSDPRYESHFIKQLVRRNSGGGGE